MASFGECSSNPSAKQAGTADLASRLAFLQRHMGQNKKESTGRQEVIYYLRRSDRSYSKSKTKNCADNDSHAKVPMGSSRQSTRLENENGFCFVLI